MCVREYVRACMRGRVCLYVRIYVCVCVYLSVVRVYVLSSVTQSVTFLVRAFSRSLHRCGSCTRESCRCSRQALPGRVSLSGNVPTEQPTLALTLCPFRGVLWREPRLCLSLVPFPLALAPPPVRALSHPLSLSPPSLCRSLARSLLLTLHHPPDTLLIHHPRVLSLSFSLLPHVASFSVPRLESLSG